MNTNCSVVDSLIFVTLSGKSSLILGENKAAFRRAGHQFVAHDHPNCPIVSPDRSEDTFDGL